MGCNISKDGGEFALAPQAKAGEAQVVTVPFPSAFDDQGVYKGAAVPLNEEERLKTLTDLQPQVSGTHAHLTMLGLHAQHASQKSRSAPVLTHAHRENPL